MLREYAGAKVPRLQKLMTEAGKATTPIPNAKVLKEEDRAASAQLHWTLLMICKGAALNIVFLAASEWSVCNAAMSFQVGKPVCVSVQHQECDRYRVSFVDNETRKTIECNEMDLRDARVDATLGTTLNETLYVREVRPGWTAVRGRVHGGTAWDGCLQSKGPCKNDPKFDPDPNWFLKARLLSFILSFGIAPRISDSVKQILRQNEWFLAPFLKHGAISIFSFQWIRYCVV